MAIEVPDMHIAGTPRLPQPIMIYLVQVWKRNVQQNTDHYGLWYKLTYALRRYHKLLVAQISTILPSIFTLQQRYIVGGVQPLLGLESDIKNKLN